MNVKAAPGLKVPKEENFRTYITDEEAVEVLDTTYYRRLVDDNSLVLVGAQHAAPPAKGGKK